MTSHLRLADCTDARIYHHIANLAACLLYSKRL